MPSMYERFEMPDQRIKSGDETRYNRVIIYCNKRQRASPPDSNDVPNDLALPICFPNR